MPSEPAPATGRDRALLLILVLGALLLRMPGLASPPTDIHHVRQSDTSSIARNFAREGIDLLRPRIDWAGPDAGTVESELPLYAGATGALWRMSGGTSPVWPRGLSILAWLLGGLALLRLVRRRLDGPAWAYLALYFFSPLALAFSRTIQPDAMALCMLLWSLERADAAGDREPHGLLSALVAGLLGGLAVASKGTLGFAAPLAVLLAVGRGGRGSLTRAAGLAAPLLLIPSAWYWHAHAHLGAEGATFGLWGVGAHKWGGPALWFDLGTWRALLGTLVTHTLTPVGLALAAVGVAISRRRPGLLPWGLGLVLGLVAMFVVAEGFRLHSYYQLLLVPFASVLVGAGALELRRRGQEAGRGMAAALLAVVLALGGLSALQGLTFARDALLRDSRIETAGLALSYVVPVGRALVVVDRHPQTLLYAIDRRGWHRSRVGYGDVMELEDFGAEFLLLTGTSPSWSDHGLLSALQDERPLVARSPGWLLFQLQRGVARPAARPAAMPGVSGDPLDEGEEP